MFTELVCGLLPRCLVSPCFCIWEQLLVSEQRSENDLRVTAGQVGGHMPAVLTFLTLLQLGGYFRTSDIIRELLSGFQIRADATKPTEGTLAIG